MATTLPRPFWTINYINMPEEVQASGSTETVKVFVRCRPLSQKELKEAHANIIKTDTKESSISLTNPDNKSEVKSFTFDATFGPESVQSEVYRRAAYPIVEAVLNGYNGTIFAYGQTGSGKTHTMMGNPDVEEQRGILPNVIKHIFDYISKRGGSSTKYLVRASFYELYNEEVRDLLASGGNSNRLEIKEGANGGVYVKDGASFVVQNAKELENLVKTGNSKRVVAATAMNAVSSRSHSIFSITVEMVENDPKPGEEAHIRVGKLHLVDLAGSERQSKTLATGDRLKEAAKINLSLTCLGNVISALVDGTSHIPYRDSKLTRLLQDSLGGNSKTVMIAAVSPASYNYDETLSTLRYANRAKRIKNKPKINEDPKDAMLREYQEEIQRLKALLASQGVGGSSVTTGQSVTGPTRSGDIKLDRDAILAMKPNMSDEDRQKLLAALASREEDLNREKQEREALAKRLEQMQGKLLVGGVNILDKAQQQERELSMQKQALEEQRRKEDLLRKELEDNEEMVYQMKESYSSLQEELSDKTVKLKKLWTVYMKEKAELQDLHRDITREREDFQETIRGLVDDLKLKAAIIESFIPQHYIEWIEANSSYDDDTGLWRIPHHNLSGNKIREKRPQNKLNELKSRSDIDENLKQLYVNDEPVSFPNHLLSYNKYTTEKPGQVQRPMSQQKSRSQSIPRSYPESRTNFSAKNLASDTQYQPQPVEMRPPTARGLLNRPKHYA